jgi:hypothetical protein
MEGHIKRSLLVLFRFIDPGEMGIERADQSSEILRFIEFGGWAAMLDAPGTDPLVPPHWALQSTRVSLRSATSVSSFLDSFLSIE